MTSDAKMLSPPSIKKVAPIDIYRSTLNTSEAPKDKNNVQWGAVLKIYGEKYNLLSKEEKELYQRRADEVNQERIIKAREWWENVDKKLIDIENRRRAKENVNRKAQNLPALPMLKTPFKRKLYRSAFAFFTKEIYDNEILVGKCTDVSKIISQMWKDLSEPERQYYVKLKDKKNYDILISQT
ncbi:hypothetical protein BB560_001356 [Smittium megazygosporum]|nr:hypothetical protein BB560_001356 [Smittium megazygosporum]